jgi:hypothetical protein
MRLTKREDEIPEEEVNPIHLDALLEELITFRINLFKITNSTIGYRDITTSPVVDIYLSDFFLEATSIQNIESVNDTLPSTLHMETRALNSGSTTLDESLNFIDEILDFEYILEIEDVDLIHFEPFFEAYANFNLTEGLLNVYSESAALEGYLIGYVKPMIENLEITPTEDDASNVYKSIMEAIGNLFTLCRFCRKKIAKLGILFLNSHTRKLLPAADITFSNYTNLMNIS